VATSAEVSVVGRAIVGESHAGVDEFFVSPFQSVDRESHSD